MPIPFFEKIMPEQDIPLHACAFGISIAAVSISLLGSWAEAPALTNAALCVSFLGLLGGVLTLHLEDPSETLFEPLDPEPHLDTYFLT